MIANQGTLPRVVVFALALIVTGCASQKTCLYPQSNLKNQYLVLFPRNVVVGADDPRDVTERHRLYTERLNSHFQKLPGAETCRTLSFRYYEGGGIGANAECQVPPPLKMRPGIYKQDGSPDYWACYSANE